MSMNPVRQGSSPAYKSCTGERIFLVPLAGAHVGCGRAWRERRGSAAAGHWLARLISFLGLVGLILSYHPADAQSAPAAGLRSTAAASGAHDTVAAIQQVFKSRRRTGTFLLAGSAAYVSVAAVGTALEDKSFFRPDEVALLATIATAPVWGWGIVKQARFSTRREQQVLADYQRLHTIPRFVRRRMRFAK